MAGKHLGNHFLLDLYDCGCSILDDAPRIEEILITAAKQTGAEVLNIFVHKFSPQGITGVVAIAESHLSIHTWPEINFVAVDIFTCGNKTIPEKAKEYFIEKLKPRHTKSEKINRGNYV